MAQVIAMPSCSALPANGGSVTYALGTSGSIDYPAARSAWQNYIYTATPAPGFSFARFEITVTKAEDGSSSTSSISVRNNPCVTDGGENRWLDGSAWWFEILSYPQSTSWISDISVVAVFEPRNSGQLVYSANQGGQLVYSANQNDALVYDGNF